MTLVKGVLYMVFIFLIGLFVIFISSMNSYGAKWAHIAFPIYLTVGLLYFSVLCIVNEKYFIGSICVIATISYLMYLVLDFKIGERSHRDSPSEWVSYLGLYPVLVAVIALLFLPNNFVVLKDEKGPVQSDNVYYSNCSEARKAGVTPIYENQSGYRRGLDRDNDGIACE
ncbi:excalibur calcium-binding domain-containing protein [Paenibacillus sp. ACRSA]|uniref:excalibur calcium-binding domain-containing protein n=1 Tax=Paenibacillus sp. ACRSA TaxID=2918211 RepID=UPI0031BAA5F8